MRLRTLTGLVAAGALALAACGDDDDSDTDAATEETEAEDTTTTEDSASEDTASISVAETDLGEVLVDAEGFTLYAFTNDTAGEPTCEGGCADAWPPAIVEGEPTPGEGVDASAISVVERSDGTSQLKAGDYPLYRFSGDAAAGETNGQGSGGVWFASRPTGPSSRMASPPPRPPKPTPTSTAEALSQVSGRLRATVRAPALGPRHERVARRLSPPAS